MACEVPEFTSRLKQQVQKVIVGKEEQIRLMLAALLAEGHILLDDLPGVGKTTLVKTLSMALGCDFKRVQFTPDLLPSDVVGMNIFDRSAGAFRAVRGPVETNIFLADEINRAIPRTQAALLEAMEERMVTIDGKMRPLPRPFFVMATQNPVDLESTFHLPAAQMDRFLLRLSLGYPDGAEEARMLRTVGDRIPFGLVEAVTNPEEIEAMQELVQEVTVSDRVLDYLVSLCAATRFHALVRNGVSPRGSRALYKSAKALAAMDGRDFVTPDDVQTLAEPVFSHRLTLSAEAGISGETAQTLVRKLLESTPVPPARNEVFHAEKR
jgi:MoxR-like ATPase